MHAVIWLLACVAAAQVLLPENARIALQNELWHSREAIGEYRRGGAAADGVIDRIVIWDKKTSSSAIRVSCSASTRSRSKTSRSV